MTPRKKKGRNEASVFLDNLSEFLGATEGQDLNDIKSELREEGIDVDAFVNKAKEEIAQKSSEAKRSWIAKAKAGHAVALERINKIVLDIPKDAEALRGNVRRLISGRQTAGAYFRNYKDMSYDDLKKLYEDYMRLEHLKEKEEDEGNSQ